jgi:taurine dioxygenase
MAFDVTEISPALGARISGLDLRETPSGATVEALLRAWHEHLILLFREPELSEDQQLRFAESFGRLGVRARRPDNRPEGAAADNVMLVTNIRKDGVPIGSLPDGEMFFHHDMCYVEAPHMATMLYGIQFPSHGGNTLFANMYRAYETLPAELKRAIDGRRVMQVYQYDPTARVAAGEDLTDYDHCWQPAVIVHPATGRKALYVNELMSTEIEGLPADESEAVLQALFANISRPENVYEHVWQAGDLLMWDNRCTCHARTNFPTDEIRLLRRCTVAGAPMKAA